jgi:RNA-directed DNA polymerase
VMEDGLVSPSVEGTPQGGPLSPLLSNLVLDELDRELARAPRTPLCPLRR